MLDRYIGTTYHTTYGPAHYNDTINMVIYPDVLYEVHQHYIDYTC